MTRAMKTAIKGHEQIFNDSDEYFIDIAWNDIPEFCEVMKSIVSNDLEKEIIYTVKHFHNFLEVFGDTISEDLYAKCDSELFDAMRTLETIAKRNLF